MSAIVGALFVIWNIASQLHYVLAREQLIDVRMKVTWHEAQQFCESIGYHLLSVKTHKERDYISQYLNDKGYKDWFDMYWLSATCGPYGCQKLGGTWHWEDWKIKRGRKIHFKKRANLIKDLWCPDEPDMLGGSQPFLSMHIEKGQHCYHDWGNPSNNEKGYVICTLQRKNWLRAIKHHHHHGH